MESPAQCSCLRYTCHHRQTRVLQSDKGHANSNRTAGKIPAYAAELCAAMLIANTAVSRTNRPATVDNMHVILYAHPNHQREHPQCRNHRVGKLRRHADGGRRAIPTSGIRQDAFRNEKHYNLSSQRRIHQSAPANHGREPLLMDGTSHFKMYNPPTIQPVS